MVNRKALHKEPRDNILSPPSIANFSTYSTKTVSNAIGDLLTTPMCLEVFRDVIADIQLGTDADLMKTRLLPGIAVQEMHDDPRFFIDPMCIGMLIHASLEVMLAGLLRRNNIPDVVNGTPVTDIMEPWFKSRIKEILPVLIQEETDKFTAAGHTIDVDAVDVLHKKYTELLIVDDLMEQLGITPDMLKQLMTTLGITPEELVELKASIDNQPE